MDRIERVSHGSATRDEVARGGCGCWYGGAVHAFTVEAAGNDPSKGAAYDAKADRRSWDEMVRFFQEVFGR